MENANWSYEQRALINELTEGMELVRQLSFHLNSASMDETQQLLLQRILSSYEKSLLILQWSGSAGLPQPAAPAITGMPEFSLSPDGSPQSEELDQGGFKDQSDASKKRKVLPIWTNQVRIRIEIGLEGPIDDGYNWRKYGQKDILGTKYPRSYYRCTYRNVQNCWATKQVQRSDEDPAVFDITYKGKHTCSQGPHTSTNLDPKLPENQGLKQNTHINNYQQQQQPSDLLSNLRANLRVNTENLEDNNEHNMAAAPFTFPSTSLPFSSGLDENNRLAVFSPMLTSPAKFGLNYFPVPQREMNSFGVTHDLPHSEPNLTEIISANNSTGDSPITRLGFSLENCGPENNPFDSAGFFA